MSDPAKLSALTRSVRRYRLAKAASAPGQAATAPSHAASAAATSAASTAATAPAATATAATATASATAGQLNVAILRRGGVLLVEDVERGEAHIGDLFFAESDLVIG